MSWSITIQVHLSTTKQSRLAVSLPNLPFTNSTLPHLSPQVVAFVCADRRVTRPPSYPVAFYLDAGHPLVPSSSSNLSFAASTHESSTPFPRFSFTLQPLRSWLHGPALTYLSRLPLPRPFLTTSAPVALLKCDFKFNLATAFPARRDETEQVHGTKL
jgi:hypothetical protein